MEPMTPEEVFELAGRRLKGRVRFPPDWSVSQKRAFASSIIDRIIKDNERRETTEALMQSASDFDPELFDRAVAEFRADCERSKNEMLDQLFGSIGNDHV